MARMISLVTNEQKVLTIESSTMDGTPASVRTMPVFTVQSGDCTVEKIDEHHVMLSAGEQLGECRIQVEADVQVGEETYQARELLIVQVQGEHAAKLALTEGAAQPKPRVRHMASTAMGTTESHAEPSSEPGTTRRRG